MLIKLVLTDVFITLLAENCRYCLQVELSELLYLIQVARSGTSLTECEMFVCCVDVKRVGVFESHANTWN